MNFCTIRQRSLTLNIFKLHGASNSFFFFRFFIEFCIYYGILWENSCAFFTPILFCRYIRWNRVNHQGPSVRWPSAERARLSEKYSLVSSQDLYVLQASCCIVRRYWSFMHRAQAWMARSDFAPTLFSRKESSRYYGRQSKDHPSFSLPILVLRDYKNFFISHVSSSLSRNASVFFFTVFRIARDTQI